jgi:hypothetical protein
MEGREMIREKKEAGLPKPWTTDEVFQHVYFCNVYREHDRVTKFIRRMYSPRFLHPLFVHNIILSRFLNWPDTLDELGYQDTWDPPYVKQVLNEIKASGKKVWGAAYVVTTHGLKMDKIDYLCDRVLPSIQKVLAVYLPWETCSDASHQLQHIEGVSTFMAGQVIADLKNTPGYSLANAPDWNHFALPGPGSIRGMNWVCGWKVPANEWKDKLNELHHIVKAAGWPICQQDLQNCLCEFDKYMRVKNGTGTSKRHYNGT